MKKLTPLPKLLAKAQTVFNAWVRERDSACISCGGAVDHAGHYFSAGHYSALRFNEENVNGQCIRCNNYMHGNLIHYRKGLIKKISEKAVNELELSVENNRLKKWSRAELDEIILKYGKAKKGRGKAADNNLPDES
jgi:hypothetical protein